MYKPSLLPGNNHAPLHLVKSKKISEYYYHGCRYTIINMFIQRHICDALRDLVSFVQFYKNVKNTHGGVLLFKSNIPPWVLFTFFILYKWYQITQNITYRCMYNVLFWNQSIEVYYHKHCQTSFWKVYSLSAIYYHYHVRFS